MLFIKKYQIILGFCLMLFTSSPVLAQIAFNDDVDDTTPAAPIDGLIGLGIAIGAFYGIKKVKNNIALKQKR
jgi:hypothetical protein